MVTSLQTPVKPVRHFLSQQLVIDSWEKAEKFYTELLAREIRSLADLEKWLKDRSELEAVVEEEGAWRYIRMSINTKDEKAVADYNYFVSEVEPKIAPFNDKLNRKLHSCEFTAKADREKYFIYLRGVEQELKLFREENVPLQAEISLEAQKYGAITGAQSVSYKGKEMTMPKAAMYMKSIDRVEREEVYRLMNERREKDTDALNKLFGHLMNLRHKVAENAGFKNYRDYMFAALGRFDYSVEDCENFHSSIRSEVVPITTGFMKERQEKLKLDKLKPWDLEVDISGKPALHPFTNGAGLVKKTVDALKRVHPYFSDCIRIMNEMGHLDLESKDGKAPGGYNYPLYEIGVPFIFMNAVGTQRDLVTMVHEGGHAIHSFLTRNLELTAFKGLPSEVAELASMSMELISMDVWNEFYTDEEELNRAKRDQLEKIISILPWIATVDKFQHWLYLNHTHTPEERKDNWLRISEEFSSKMVDWTGYESSKENNWQRQLHIYEVPFYYIEYGMAQLGAIAIWRNYKRNPGKSLQQYIDALSLGYTKSIPEIYKTAGIEFNFSQAYVSELAGFVKSELEKLK